MFSYQAREEPGNWPIGASIGEAAEKHPHGVGGELISIIVSADNCEPALEAVLRGLVRQTDKNFEIIVADRGPVRGNPALVARCRNWFERPLTYISSPGPEAGWAEIKNRAVAAAKGELCIFLDVDCIPRPDFVALHRQLAEPGWFVSGESVTLSAALSNDVLAERKDVARWGLPRWTILRVFRQIDRMIPLVRLPLGVIRKLRPCEWRVMHYGCLAVRRDDLLRVDGFEELATGLAHEQLDLVVRLIHSGTRHKNGAFATTVLRLETDRERAPAGKGVPFAAKLRSTHHFRALTGLSTLNWSAGLPAPPSTAVPNSSSGRKVAIAIVSLFQSGGLQRDCMAIAEALKTSGHSVTIFTSRIRGYVETDVPIVVLPTKSWTNHARNAEFASALANRTKRKFDLVVGFDKLSGLDVLYCADPPIVESVSRVAQVLRPRYRTFARLERACFERGAPPRLMLLDAKQANAYRRLWSTEPERITVISPLVNRTRRRPELRNSATRARLRTALGIKDDELILLSVGGQPYTKGLDRTIQALSDFPSARLLNAGIPVGSSQWRQLLKLAAQMGVDSQVVGLGVREDIPELMAASDLLVHVARRDTTGTVILEAIVNGLPVIATAACGFSSHVRSAGAGIVVPEPYAEADFVAAVHEAMNHSTRAVWSARAVDYGQRPDLYNGVQEAVIVIEENLPCAIDRAAKSAHRAVVS